MKKQELLKTIDSELLEKLYAFCYSRSSDSYEAQDLCSDIVFALVKASKREGEISDVYAFIWRIARNIYADFCEKRRRHADTFCDDGEEILPFIASEEDEEEEKEQALVSVYRRIAFLTKAYREVMIAFYLDGLSAAEIAEKQGISENAVRQRLFSARKKIKSEVEEMTETYTKPVALEKIYYQRIGTGSPACGNPWKVCNRQFSNHIVWLCRKKPMTAAEITEELNVPTLYVEEELEILRKGENGKYGLLRKLENGRYAINIVLWSKEEMARANKLYTSRLSKIGDTIVKFIEDNREEYLSLPYLNKKVDMNLIIWQQVFDMATVFSDKVDAILKEKYFAEYKKPDRPYSSFGYVAGDSYYGCGWDGASADDILGYDYVHFDNIYISRIKKHFHCGVNIHADKEMRLAIRAIHGLPVSELSEAEKEHAAKAIECGYLYRDGDTLYTKILVSNADDSVFSVTAKLAKGYFDADAEETAREVAALIREIVPEYLLGEWKFANSLASMPIIDALVEVLIEKGILTPPENGIGAEGCWFSVKAK